MSVESSDELFNCSRTHYAKMAIHVEDIEEVTLQEYSSVDKIQREYLTLFINILDKVGSYTIHEKLNQEMWIDHFI